MEALTAIAAFRQALWYRYDYYQGAISSPRAISQRTRERWNFY